MPVIFGALLVLLAVTRAIAEWPGEASEGVVLVGLLILALLPVLLLLLGNLAGGGGSVEAFGVRIRFAETARLRQEVTVPPRLGLQPGITLNDSSTMEILDTLRDAVGHDVAVVDLGDGSAWWETRLLVLCAGAARLNRPVAIAFVATVGGNPNAFKGWGPPNELLQALLAKRHDLRIAYERAVAVHRQWELAIPPPPNDAARPRPDMPFPIGPDTGVEWVVFPDGVERSQLAAEQILALELGPIENQGDYGVITPTRLADLFEPVLRTRSLEIDQGNRDTEWTQTILSTTDRFIALKRGERYAGLLPRDEAVNDILRAVLEQPS